MKIKDTHETELEIVLDWIEYEISQGESNIIIETKDTENVLFLVEHFEWPVTVTVYENLKFDVDIEEEHEIKTSTANNLIVEKIYWYWWRYFLYFKQ